MFFNSFKSCGNACDLLQRTHHHCTIPHDKDDDDGGGGYNDTRKKARQTLVTLLTRLSLLQGMLKNVEFGCNVQSLTVTHHVKFLLNLILYSPPLL